MIEFLTGIDTADVSKHEKGKKKPNFKNFNEVCHCVECSSKRTIQF